MKVGVVSSCDGDVTSSPDSTLFFLDQKDDLRERVGGCNLGDVGSGCVSFPFPLGSGLIRLRNEVVVNESPRLRRAAELSAFVDSCVSDTCRGCMRCELLTRRTLEGEGIGDGVGDVCGLNDIADVSLDNEVDAWGRPIPSAA